MAVGMLMRTSSVHLLTRLRCSSRINYQSQCHWLFSHSSFRTSSHHHAVWFMTPISRLAVAAGSRIARMIWKRLPQESKESIKDRIKRSIHLLYGTGVVCVMGCVTYYYTHVEVTPITHRKRYMMYKREEVRELLCSENEGDYLEVILRGGGAILPASHPDYQLVLTTLSNVLHSNIWSEDIHHIPWRLIVVDNDEQVNAISLPTGDIIVFSGMIRACYNNDELGLIISHEMAHVILDHGVEMLSHTGLVSFFGLFFIAAIWYIIPSDIISFFMHQLFNGTTTILLQNPYSRQLEHEADQVGLMLASNACYNPDNAIKIWKHFPTPNIEDEYLSTHPCNEKRLALLTHLLPIAKELYESSQCDITWKNEIKRFTKLAKKWLQGN